MNKKRSDVLCPTCGINEPVKRSGRCKDCDRLSCVKHRANLKQEIMDWYGGKCRCCGEFHIDCLTLDHINDDGAKEFKRACIEKGITKRITRSGGGCPLYGRIKRSGYENRPLHLQVLCWNCQWGKRIGKGFCCHNPDIDLRIAQ